MNAWGDKGLSCRVSRQACTPRPRRQALRKGMRSDSRVTHSRIKMKSEGANMRLANNRRKETKLISLLESSCFNER